MLDTLTDIGCSLIAIMLGRLKMDIDECIKHYEQDMIKIFGDKEREAWLSKFAREAKGVISTAVEGRSYDAGPLEKTVQKLVSEKLGNKDAMLLDDSNKCKVYGTPHAPKQLTHIPSQVRHDF